MLYTEWVNAIGYVAAGLVIATYPMRTMIPLRMVSPCASGHFLTYGLLVPSLLQKHDILPLKAFCSRQMIKCIGQMCFKNPRFSFYFIRLIAQRADDQFEGP